MLVVHAGVVAVFARADAVRHIMFSMQDEELRLNDMAESLVSNIHHAVWISADLTPAQSKLLWIMVIQKLLKTVWIDCKSEVIKELLTKTP